MSSNDNEFKDHNYIKLAQFEAALSMELSFKPKSFETLLGLNQNFDINYRIPKNDFITSNRSYMTGTNLLDMAFDELQNNMFEMFINCGADFTSVNSNRCTIVHNIIGDNLGKQLAATKTSGSLENYEFINTALNAHVNLKISKNPRNSYGLSHFHIACMMNHTKAVKYFLKNKTQVDEAIDKDSPILPGFTALHFAAKYASYETAELLLNYGADINLKDINGISALHLIVQERIRTWPAVLRRMKLTSLMRMYNITEYFDENEKILKLFLKKDSISPADDIGFSKFQAACTLQDSSLVEQFLSESSINLDDPVKSESPIWPDYTALHFAAHFNYETFQLLLEKGANMEARDIQGTSPFDICLLQFKVADIHSILLQNPNWQNILFSDGKTKLLDFIWAMQESSEFSSFLNENVTNINLFIPLDSPVCAGYTPLHLAVIFSEKPPDYESEDAGYPTLRYESYHPTQKTLYGTRIQKCLDSGANVTAQDSRGLTPLHWAFRLQETALVRLLLDHYTQFTNPIDEDGLSHLHIACASKSELAVLKLLLFNRADVNSRVKADYSWYTIHSDRSRSFRKSGSTPLHFAVECPKITEALLKCSADVLATDDEGFNPLERVLGGRLARDTQLECQRDYSEDKKKILLLLIRRWTEELGDSADGPERLLCCYRLLDSKFLMRVFESDDEMRDELLGKVGLTSLHLACLKNDVDGVRMSLLQQGVDVDGRVRETSPMWSGLTPLYCYVVGRGLRKDGSDDFSAVKLLLANGADVTKMCSGDTAVHKAFYSFNCQHTDYGLDKSAMIDKNDQILVKLLMSYHKDFTVNPTSTSGLSHLHVACAFDKVEMVEGFLKNGGDVNRQIDHFCYRYGGDTPLHFAALYGSKGSVDALLKRGADVRATNRYGSTPLHIAAISPFKDLNILKALLSAGADANAQNIVGTTPAELMIRYTSFSKDDVDVFLKNGFQANVMSPVTRYGCLARALFDNESFDFVYEMFVESADMKRLNEMNCNAIHNVVSLRRPGMYSIDDHAVDEAFPPVDDYTKAIEGLTKLDLNIDQQDRQGRTPLHYAAEMQNVTAVLGLLNNGADFNVADESGKTAFTYTVEVADRSSFESYNSVDERIMQIFTSHVYKLALVNLDVDARNRKLKKRVRRKRSIQIPNVEDCLEELEKLREARIKSCSVTLNDFLRETGAVITLSRLPLEERRIVDKLFNNTGKLRRKYPEFAGILILQYRKALERVKLIPLALVSLNVLMEFNVPLVCSDIILKYLSNSNLKNLIAAADKK